MIEKEKIMNWDWKATAIIFLVTLVWQNAKTFFKPYFKRWSRDEDDAYGTVLANVVMCIFIIVFVALIP